MSGKTVNTGAECGVRGELSTGALMAWAASLERFVRERAERKLTTERLVAAFGEGVIVEPIRFELEERNSFSYFQDTAVR